ncbi:response regulator [Paenibacillus thalictri]|uniref:Response regulator n=1 Tax=Paenibacillus thalictri TaxID=2527873 RepID=A0A4Q9DU11_9BACL|nr:response regulator [Paenibacillus thalictri]TBL80463.1 response regulator [Paenibacillus thalictri]
MSSVMDILLVEDETEVLEGICLALRQLVADTCRIYAVGNAEDAREILQAIRPRVIVTDIVLPGMSGLELLEEVRTIPGYSPKTIVISSYNEFAYAQQSLRLGALDYVLKPFDKSEFIQKIAGVLELIEGEDRKISELQHQIEHSRMGTKVLMDQYILSFCTKKTHLQEHIYHRLQLWNLTWLTTTPYRLFAFGLHGDAHGRDKEVELQLFAVSNVAAETLQRFPPSYLLKNVHNRWIVITAYPDAEQIMEDIRDNVRKFQRQELFFGASATMFSFQSLSDAYDQAIQALRWAFANRSPLLFYSDISEGRGENMSGDADADCVSMLMNGDSEGIEAVVGRKIDNMVRFTHVQHRKQLAQSCLDWIIAVQALLNEKTGFQMDQIPLSLWEKLEQCATMEEIKRELTGYYVALSSKIASDLPVMSNAIIEQAKAIIAEESHGELSLNRLAERLAIHPVWLSHLFKKETGQNFSDYMIDLKIDNAKKLLRESSLKIYEIAAKIGYQDLQHFGKIFKKRTGMSPKEFRYGK